MFPIELLDNKSEILTYNVSDMPIKLGKACGKDSLIRTLVNHWHNDFEFTYIVNGEMSYCVNGQVIRLTEGQMLFINSARMHYNFWDTTENGEFICTIFHPSLLNSNTTEKYLNKIIGEKTPPYILFHPEIPREKKIIDLVLKMYETAAEQDDGFEFRVMSCVYEISLALLNHMKMSSEIIPQGDKDLEAMHRMVGFVQQKYNDKIYLADIAAAGFVSRSVCFEIFKKYSRQTPINYLTEYRISKSADLLVSGNLSITEIALLCGFRGSSYFTETFRKIMKCTPTEFRQKSR